MKTITIPEFHGWDYAKGEFVDSDGATIRIEHSLVSISKWETKWKKSFIDSLDKLTVEELTDYVRCMTITQNVDPAIYDFLTKQNLKDILAYLGDPMTATTFYEDPGSGKGRSHKIITSEQIYAKMVSYNIPFETQKWPLNRLVTLIRILDDANEPKKKRSKKDIIARNAELNKARRAKLGTKG